jgi:hypothetical protein
VTDEEIVRAKARARQPTAHERRFGLVVRQTRPLPARRDFAASAMDPLRNRRANGSNRSYDYLPASELFRGNTWK